MLAYDESPELPVDEPDARLVCEGSTQPACERIADFDDATTSEFWESYDDTPNMRATTAHETALWLLLCLRVNTHTSLGPCAQTLVISRFAAERT